MTWFFLPPVEADHKAAFANADGAAEWLAQQPQANAPAMQLELATQIGLLNTCALPARERFKTLEILRRTLFTVAAESQRRFAYRALPLASGEQATFDSARRLWRTCAVAYLHCLRAVLDKDPTLAGQGARVAHRALASLRMEQASCYAAGVEPDGEFWQTLHAVMATAEQLDCAGEPVSDRLLGETAESTVNGQYAMVLLLHLARPFTLSRSQLSAATRWFARWREQATLRSTPGDARTGHCIALDLRHGGATPPTPGPRAAEPRWLALGGVLRKMRKRLEALAAGGVPEELKLGSGLSAEACSALLKILTENLQQPLPALTVAGPGAPTAALLSGFDPIYRQLGGKSLKAFDEASLRRDRRAHEQIAVFGHIVRTEENDAVQAEAWRIAARDGQTLHLCRPPAGDATRFSPRALIALQLPGAGHYALAHIASLCCDDDGTLHAFAQLLPGTVQTMVAEVYERASGRSERHPAFLLPAVGGGAYPAQALLAAGLAARAQSINLLQDDGKTLRLDHCIERGSDYERWACLPA